MDIAFIKLHPQIEVAQDLQESPLALLRYTPQIQFKPFDEQPYVQITASKDIGLTIADDYTVSIVRCRDLYEVDVTEHVLIRPIFLNGVDQLMLRIAYLREDFGTEPVYFKVNRGTIVPQTANPFYYSNKFLVTATKIEFTSRLDYFNSTNNFVSMARAPMESIRLAFYFNDHIDQTEVDTYYQITTGQNVNPRILIKEYTEWQTQIFNAWTFKRLSRAFYFGRAYINQVRHYPVEGIEYNPREGHTNVSEMTFITDPDDTDTINIIPVIIGDDVTRERFLSSSSQLSSTNFLSSQEYITT